MNILIATPTLGTVKTAYMTSIINLMATVRHAHPHLHVSVITIDNQLTQRARNLITHHFMQNTQYTHLFFIDSDIAFAPGDFIKLINTAQSPKQPRVLCAMYPNKQYHWTPDRCVKGRNALINFSSKITPDNLKTYDATTHLCIIDKTATGFLLIERSVFTTLAPEIAEYGYNTATIKDFWNCKVIDGSWETEDYVFSHILKQHNIDIWCDMSIELQHIGDNMYSASPLEYFGL